MPSSTTYTAEIDGSKAKSLRSFYPRIAKALFFPDYFGKNLDALFDSLCSLDNIDAGNVLLVIKNADAFLSIEKTEKRNAVLQIFKDAALPENRYDNKTFSVQFI